jgi:all-trans-retinol dehydrogenase (NAD+)
MRSVSKFLDKGVLNNWKNDAYDWDKEIVLVTGGSDGIGAIVVKMLTAKGIKVAILDIQTPKFECKSIISTSKRYLMYLVTPNVKFYNCDLTDPAQIHSTAAAIAQDFGHPTIVVSNAGFARGNSILSTKETDLNLTFKINSLSHYHLAQAFLPAMIKNDHGLWLTVASLAGYVTAPRMTDYSASKASAIVFHEGLASELPTIYEAPSVRTVLVCQGYTKTTLFQGFKSGDGFLMYDLDPATVAESIVNAVLKGQSDHIILPKASGYTAGFRNWPGWMQDIVRKDLKKLMVNWHGRQVPQPSEAGKSVDSESEPATPIGASKSVETSGVLV